MPWPKIELQTALGWDIPNARVDTLSPSEYHQFNDLQTRYEGAGKAITERAKPTPEYDCHGLTFASRRTSLGDVDINAVIAKIIDDDKYKKIDDNQVLAGDVVIYYSDKEAEHSGIVIDPIKSPINAILPNENFKILSKWGKYKEFIHKLYEVPFATTNIFFYRITNDHYSIRDALRTCGGVPISQYTGLFISQAPAVKGAAGSSEITHR